MAEGLKLVNDLWYHMKEDHPVLAEEAGSHAAICAVIIYLTEPDSEFYRRLKEFVEGEE